MAVPAVAAPPPGTDMDSPVHKWFERQRSVTGTPCCQVSDGHVLEETEWRIGKLGHYEVLVHGEWQPVSSAEMMDANVADPNPTGKGIAWYSDYGVYGFKIWCFTPGTMD